MYIVRLKGQVPGCPCLAAASLPVRIYRQLEVVVRDVVILIQTAVAVGTEAFLRIPVDQVSDYLIVVTRSNPGSRIVGDPLYSMIQPEPLKSSIAPCCRGVRKFQITNPLMMTSDGPGKVESP